MALSPVVVTNPPFALAAEMIRHLLGDLECRYVALLLKSTYWHAEKRTGLWRWRPPAYCRPWRWHRKMRSLPNRRARRKPRRRCPP